MMRLHRSVHGFPAQVLLPVMGSVESSRQTIARIGTIIIFNIDPRLRPAKH